VTTHGLTALPIPSRRVPAVIGLTRSVAVEWAPTSAIPPFKLHCDGRLGDGGVEVEVLYAGGKRATQSGVRNPDARAAGVESPKQQSISGPPRREILSHGELLTVDVRPAMGRGRAAGKPDYFKNRRECSRAIMSGRSAVARKRSDS